VEYDYGKLEEASVGHCWMLMASLTESHDNTIAESRSMFHHVLRILADIVEKFRGFSINQRDVVGITPCLACHLRDQLAPEPQWVVCFHEQQVIIPERKLTHGVDLGSITGNCCPLVE